MDLIENDFIEVTQADIPLLEKYAQCAAYEESNHNIVNMFQWKEQYPLWQFHTDHYLLLLGVHKGKLFSYMPLCKPEYFSEALLKAQSIFKENGIPFELSCFTEEGRALARKVFPNMIGIAEAEASDYIYEADKLRTLAGKKLQKRRNNYNNFIHGYDGRWSYEAMDETNVHEVKAYLESWKSEDDDEYLRYEINGTFAVLDLFGKLPYRGGVIRIDGVIKAFIIASQPTKRMIQINIEKAEPSIRGLYQAIEKHFLMENFTEAEFVNREDDMGLESLRAAKQALNPCCMIAKYRIRETL